MGSEICEESALENRSFDLNTHCLKQEEVMVVMSQYEIENEFPYDKLKKLERIIKHIFYYSNHPMILTAAPSIFCFKSDQYIGYKIGI